MSKIFIFILLLLTVPSYAASITDVDPRYCHAINDIPRTSTGTIKRDRYLLTVFKLKHPCPATGLSTGKCSGWQIDHVIPLACGGCDEMFNLQWLPDQIKTCAGDFCKDRWERTLYCKDNYLGE